jgi:hypothetical protein
MDKTKEQLTEELKQARLELHYLSQSGSEMTNFINYDFSRRLNWFIEALQIAKKQYPRIALYGHGLAGRLAAQQLGDSVAVIVDRGATEEAVNGVPLCKPEELNKYAYDCVFITVLGREQEIAAYLQGNLGISPDRIRTFDLAKDPVAGNAAVEMQENHNALVVRLKNAEPVIGANSLNVQIQTVSTCNAQCYFCPYVGSWHDRNPGRMDDGTYQKIIAELAAFKIMKFCPYLENEPLMDPKIFERIQHAIKVLQPECVELASNLGGLAERHVKGLIEVLAKVPHELRISFHGVDKRSYEEIMGLNFERTLSHVKKVVALMQELPLTVSIRGAGAPRQACQGGRDWFGEIEYRKFWSEQLAEFARKPKVEFFTYHDRAGQTQLKEKGMSFDVVRNDLTDFYCSRFDRWAHFLYTGEPILCCMDYNRETILGESAKSAGIEALYSGERYLDLLKKGTGLCASEKNFICKRCISPGG